VETQRSEDELWGIWGSVFLMERTPAAKTLGHSGAWCVGGAKRLEQREERGDAVGCAGPW
jgi:hypothetical protein